LGLHFFGLTPEYRVILFRQIHEIVFNGGGGYDFDTVYNMPVWLRKFTFNMLKEHFDKVAETSADKNPSSSKPKLARPPTYVSKARK